MASSGVRGLGELVLCSPRLQALASRILEDKTFTRDPEAEGTGSVVVLEIILCRPRRLSPCLGLKSSTTSH